VTPNQTTDARWRAAAVAIAPAVLLTAFLYHPYIAVPPRDTEAVAAAAAADTLRWGLAHLLTAVGSGLLILAFLAVRHALRESGDDRSSAWGIGFVAFGSALYGFLPGLEFAPLAAAETGGDVLAAQESLASWFVPTLVVSAFAFGIGVVGFARGIARTPLLGPRTTRLVVVALLVMALSRFVPLGAAQFHVQGVAGVVALWPIAFHLWQRAAPAPLEASRPSPVA
jgi:hypothetical protein